MSTTTPTAVRVPVRPVVYACACFNCLGPGQSAISRSPVPHRSSVLLSAKKSPDTGGPQKGREGGRGGKREPHLVGHVGSAKRPSGGALGPLVVIQRASAGSDCKASHTAKDPTSRPVCMPGAQTANVLVSCWDQLRNWLRLAASCSSIPHSLVRGAGLLFCVACQWSAAWYLTVQNTPGTHMPMLFSLIWACFRGLS